MKILQLLAALCFWSFIAIKVAGSSLALWSWWWILVPVVPVLGLIVERAGL